MAIQIKRAYEKPSRNDGARVLVDRLWPRGITKDGAKLKAWLKEIAPSDELRKWYHERPTQWAAFRRRYIVELSEPQALAALEQLYALVEEHRDVTLIYASKIEHRNNASVLKELLEGARKPPTSSGPAKAASVQQRARGKR
jgi:uncharacterized protein YeaO (DUF488 family)